MGFTKVELANSSSNTPFVLPSIYAIDDFIVQHAGLQVKDNLDLLMLLYECYSRYQPEYPFEKFITWGPTILGDFDLIDQYLVEDPKVIFNYLSEKEALSRWNIEEASSGETLDSFQSRFKTLASVYNDFKYELISKSYSYRGLSYRICAEEFTQIDSNDLKFEHYFFIGLNALSKAEISIINSIVALEKGSCYWDTDTYFFNDEHQAGEMLTKYAKYERFGNWNPPKSYLTSSSKNINFYKVPFESFQPKLTTHLVQQYSNGKTLVVVPDEGQIPSLLFSLPEHTEAFNISMGYRIADSKLASFFEKLFQLQLIGFTGVQLRSSLLIELKSDALVSLLQGEAKDEFYKLINRVENNNLTYVPFNFDHGFLVNSFSKWESSTAAIESIAYIFNFFLTNLGTVLDPLEKEFFYLFGNIIEQLKSRFLGNDSLSLRSLNLLLKELYKLEKVAFEGDPQASLQFMSMLETRCIDFDNVIVLSMNEGVLPSSNKANSLLPFEVLEHFDIPVYKNQDSVMHYHFLRLLMRAQNVDIVFVENQNSGVGGGKEESRFSKQLRYDLFQKNSKINWHMRELGFATSSKTYVKQGGLSVKNTPNIRERIIEELSQNGLSPTSITEYLSCSLKFYLKRIAKLSNQEIIDENVGNDVFGNWIHHTLEELNLSVKLKQLNKEDIEVLKSKSKFTLDQIITKDFGGFDVEIGQNYVRRVLAEEMLNKYFEYRQSNFSSFKIMAAEQRIEQNLNIAGIKVKLKGSIDAVEDHGNHLELIDYKTGKAESNDLTIKDLSIDFVNPDKDKLRQLMWYIALYEKKEKPIKGRIYALRNISVQLTLEEDQEKVKQVVYETVNNLVEDVLSDSYTFEQTTESKRCEYCDYKTLCMRI